jgi:hypothetical protein
MSPEQKTLVTATAWLAPSMRSKRATSLRGLQVAPYRELLLVSEGANITHHR